MQAEIKYKVQLNTDCEGPTCLNDNAYELCVAFLNHGRKFFKQLSSYDDIIYLYKDKYKKQYPKISDDYSAGDTLKLILPFLRAKDVSNKIIEKYVNEIKKIKWMKGAKKTHKFLYEKEIPVYEISTSYEEFAKAVAKEIFIKDENLYCTEINLDKHLFSKEEKKKINEYRKEIINLPTIRVPQNNPKEKSLDPESNLSVERLNEIFWVEMPEMDCWSLIYETKVMNGNRKVEAISHSLGQKNYMKNLIYVGDSITDKEALSHVKNKGGLAISFNGNKYAIDNAEVACISDDSFGIAVIVDYFSKVGRNQLNDFIKNKSPLLYNELPKNTLISFVTDENKEELIKKSTQMRIKARKAAGVLS